jgi:hypothetical protein
MLNLSDFRKRATSIINEIVPELSPKTFLATNIITEYKNFDNPDIRKLNKCFDYIDWNPYWDGKWCIEKAISRFHRFFPWTIKKEMI